VLHLHHSSGDVVVPEALPKLDPSEGVAVPSWVGLPPVESGASQLPCCVQNSLPVVALSDIQLALHQTKPVVYLDWISRMGEHRRVTSQSPHACRGAAAVEEVAAECGSAAESE
jgi:hypothetical protein